MGKDLTRQDRAQDLIERMRPEFAKVLPKWLTPERMARVVLTEFRKAPKLLDCNEMSVMKCAMQCAELGLEPGSAMSQAHLIPFGRECTLIIGFRGLLELARRSGQLQDIQTEVVCEHDEFDYELGMEPKLRHKPNLKERGKPILVYAVAHLKDGGTQSEVMTVEDVNKIRDGSKNLGADSPWRLHWAAMARKTVLRRLCKYLPAAVMPPAAQAALTTEDEKFYDTTARIMSEETARATDRLKDRLKGSGEPAEPEGEGKEVQDEPKPKTKPKNGRKGKRTSKFTVSGSMEHAVEEAAREAGIDLTQFLESKFNCSRPKELASQEDYEALMEILESQPVNDEH